MAGMPSALASFAASTQRGRDRRGLPGMEGIGISGSVPPWTTSDQIRSDGVSTLSRTIRRVQSAWRRRRGRR